VAAAQSSDGDALLEAVGDARVDVREVTDQAPHLQLQGPESRAVLQSLTAADLSQLGYYRFLPAPVEVAGLPVVVARCGYSGELGYELTCRPHDAPRLWQRLLATGRVTPYGRDAVETLRQEAGLILVGSDYRPGDTDPYEMNLDRVVRLDAGWFRGREALRERGGRPARRLTTLLLDGADVPCAGALVHRAGEPVGEVRSACASPTLGRVLALAALDVVLRAEGAAVSVGLPAGPPAAAVVGSFPAYDPERRRPRM
jgi:aminomethyltransferase